MLRIPLVALVASVGISLAACGVVTQGSPGDAAARQRDAAASPQPGTGGTTLLDSGVDAVASGRPSTRGDGATDDVEPMSDAGTCMPPRDATVATADGSLCLEGGNCQRGGMPCCPGTVCVPCAVATSDGGFVLNVEAGPFYCNVTKR